MPILLLQLGDHGDVQPIGVYPNWRDALTMAHNLDFSDDFTSGPLDPKFEPQFQANFEAAFEPYERAEDDEDLDLTFMSPSGGWEYRLVQVEVHS